MTTSSYPDQPVLVRVWRGDHVESQHRGAWVVTDGAGRVIEGAGDAAAPFFVRSSIKCLQALPLLESGAAARYGFDDGDLALALASHAGEPMHTERVAAVLARLDLDESALGCGAHAPTDGEAREALLRAGRTPSALHNNCSGKHAGFLALARHLGQEPATYLDPAGVVQQRVRAAVEALTGLDDGRLTVGLDGCSAPTFRLPLVSLATAFARVTTPGALAPERRAACERMSAAVAAHPDLIGGTRERLCTDLARASGGALFPKIGAEGVYAVGWLGQDRALALKVDDGGARAVGPLVVGLLRRLGWLDEGQSGALAPWIVAPLVNWRGRTVGRYEVVV